MATEIPQTKKAVSTVCVHAGHIDDKLTRGVANPIYQSTVNAVPNTSNAFYYPRYFSMPNQSAVAQKIAALEHGEDALVFSSGMAAITTVMFSLLQSGDHAIFSQDVYGRAYSFVKEEFPMYGFEGTLVGDGVEEYEKAIKKNTKLIYIESPSNPLLSITDVKKIADLGKKHGLLTVIDNTFATPINQTPLDDGISIVIHSGTKYLNGHSDLCCGVVVSSVEVLKKIVSKARTLGGSLSPHDCYMLERGMKTLALRVRQHNENAMALARYLEKHSAVKKVFYAGLETHKNHEIAKRQMKGFTGMLSFDIHGTAEDSHKFVSALRLVTHASSLGGLETLVCFPCETSHSTVSPQERLKLGITDGMMRISVGIEDVNDIIADFDQALKHMNNGIF